MQPIRTIWISLVWDHPGMIPAEFGQIPISGSREQVVWSFPYIFQCKGLGSLPFSALPILKKIFLQRASKYYNGYKI